METPTADLVPLEHPHGSAWSVSAFEDSPGELVDVLEGTEMQAFQKCRCVRAPK